MIRVAALPGIRDSGAAPAAKVEESSSLNDPCMDIDHGGNRAEQILSRFLLVIDVSKERWRLRGIN